MHHFIRVNEEGKPYLGNGDGRIVAVGETVTVEGAPVLCEHGLHWSVRILDALQYAPEGAIALCEVAAGGTIVHDDDKGASTERTIVRMLTAEQTETLLREFARWCALQVIDLWDAPQIVREYLETGNEDLRDAAARAVAWAADEAAARAAWEARAAARAVARAADEAWDAQETRLATMFEEACNE